MNNPNQDQRPFSRETFSRLVDAISTAHRNQFLVSHGGFHEGSFRITFTGNPSRERLELNKYLNHDTVNTSYYSHEEDAHPKFVSSLPMNSEIVGATQKQLQLFKEQDERFVSARVDELPKSLMTDLIRANYEPARISSDLRFKLLDPAPFFEACLPVDKTPRNNELLGDRPKFPTWELDFMNGSGNKLTVVRLEFPGHDSGTAIFLKYNGIELEVTTVDRDNGFVGPGNNCAADLPESRTKYGEPIQLVRPDGELNERALAIFDIIERLQQGPSSHRPPQWDFSF